MQSLTEIRALLETRDLRPKHRLGQNFLHDQNQLRRLVGAAGIEAGGRVLEIGPGTGTLTESLLDSGCSVVAGELDEDMCSIIQERLGDRLELVRGDCLEGPRRLHPRLDQALGEHPFKLVANLPYGVASPLMSLLATDPRCLGQFVTIQREVGDRLLAEPGTKAWGPLSIHVRAHAEVRLIGRLSPNCFWPAPKVESVMISIIPLEGRDLSGREALERTVRTLFNGRRKQLGTLLGRDVVLPEGIDARRRPDSLTIEELRAMSRLDRFQDPPGGAVNPDQGASRR